ncbi:MAG: class I SAM-dependent RNA methyltransferase, partial [Candidatus Omnitrophica bacterium]|nr:class I SAM-dependent RNA methyltransferase [Candidatus Omnitrophota bacterium]
GYKAKDNSTVIDIESCPLANTAINGLLAEFRKKHIKLLKNNDRVTFRQTANDGTLFWINSFGKKEPWLKEKTVCGDFYVPQGSFFQVNPQATDVLILKVIELLKQISPAYVIDLYCGCGLFSIVAAKAIQCRATGVDSDTKAIKAAKYNAQVHGVDKQCGFLANSAENMLKEIKNKIPVKESVLIVDPPRTGLSKGIRKEIAATQFGWIIYVSCSPDTMTRDLTALCETGYELKSAEVVDMFARTSHFESIVCLNHISKIRA